MGQLIKLSGELIKIIPQMIEIIRTLIKKQKLAAAHKGEPYQAAGTTGCKLNKNPLLFLPADNNGRNSPENHQKGRTFSFSRGDHSSPATISALKPHKKEADEPVKDRQLFSFQKILLFQIHCRTKEFKVNLGFFYIKFF
jgi:hypothetical protein